MPPCPGLFLTFQQLHRAHQDLSAACCSASICVSLPADVAEILMADFRFVLSVLCQQPGIDDASDLQAGVAMGLAKTVATRFPDWGPEFATLMVIILSTDPNS